MDCLFYKLGCSVQLQETPSNQIGVICLDLRVSSILPTAGYNGESPACSYKGFPIGNVDADSLASG